MGSNSDFVIENGVLKNYTGPGGEVIIPAGVTEIGERAFFGCTGLTSVTLPASIMEINGRSFAGCTSLTKVEVAPENKRLYVEHGLVFSRNKRRLVFAPGGLTNVTIPADVTEIGGYAFYGCTGLTSVTIPEGVTEIGGSAFSGCTGLKSVTIPAGVTEIDEASFAGCTGLTGVTIPTGVTKIGRAAFHGCTGLKSVIIPEKVTEIGSIAFAGCTGLTSMTILGKPEISKEALPDEVTVIVAEQFRMSDYPTPAFKQAAARGFALRYGSGEALPEDYRADCFKYIRGQKKKLYPMALQFQPLLHVMLGEKMAPKGDLPDLIEQAALLNKPEVTAMLLDYQDKQLKPGERQKLEERKMQREMQQEMDFMLTGTLTVAAAKKDWRYEKDEAGNLTILGYKGKEAEVVVPAVIGKGKVTAIGDHAFSPSVSRLSPAVAIVRAAITSVTIPDSVTEIGGYAFYGCAGLTSVTIPAGVTMIGNYAFYNCTGLTSVTIPESVREIGEWAFSGCTGLIEVMISKGVRKIGEWAFSGCTGLTSVTVPESVREIGEEAFRGCKGLTSITIPAGVTEIGCAAFWYCTGLTSVTIPDGVTEIGGGTFADCTGLTSVTIPAGVTEISVSAFEKCKKLTIHAPVGSCAEQYAKRCNIPFVAE